MYGADQHSLFSNYVTYADFLYDVADLNPSPTHNPDTDIEELPFKIVTVAELNEEYFAKLFSYWKEQILGMTPPERVTDMVAPLPMLFSKIYLAL